MQKTNDKLDVIIVGAGPVGLIAANFLGQYGIHALLIDKEEQPYSYPRAIGIDDETLRSLQYIGFSQNEINAMRAPAKVEYFSKKDYSCFEPNPEMNPYGYPILSTFLQPKLEVTLRERLKKFPTISFMPACRFVKYQKELSSVNVELEHNNESIYRECNYLLGCDGGLSDVRQCAKFELEGETQKERWLVVDLFDSPIIQKNILQCINQHYNIRPTVTLNLPEGLRRFETRLDDQEFAKGDLSEENVNQVLGPFLQRANAKFIRSRVYVRHYRVANHFKDGNVFLLGDAAHLVPPYGGQGMCSGIRDAVNLCWKIKLCLHGKAEESLLASYEQERRAHVLQIIQFVKQLSQHVEDSAEKKNISGNITTDYYRKLKPLPLYQEGFVVHSPYAGELLPQPWVKSKEGKEGLLDDFLGKDFVILGVNCTLVLSEAWKNLGCKFINLSTRSSMQLDSDLTLLFNKENMLSMIPDQTILFIRPDKFILASCQIENFEHISQQIMGLMH